LVTLLLCIMQLQLFCMMVVTAVYNHLNKDFNFVLQIICLFTIHKYPPIVYFITKSSSVLQKAVKAFSFSVL
jgi:hypothetical protein